MKLDNAELGYKAMINALPFDENHRGVGTDIEQ